MPKTKKIEREFFTLSEEYTINRRTPIIEIISRDDTKLGEIRWYGPWRKFCFYPAALTIWDNKCLTDIVLVLNEYNLKHKNGELHYADS